VGEFEGGWVLLCLIFMGQDNGLLVRDERRWIPAFLVHHPPSNFKKMKPD
jgi:hypothetical protein